MRCRPLALSALVSTLVASISLSATSAAAAMQSTHTAAPTPSSGLNECLVDSGSAMEKKQPLVVYYSRSGTTKELAFTIAAHFCTNVIEIEDTKDRSGWWNAIGAGRDAIFKIPTEIKPIESSIESYDVVIVCSPMWAMTIPPAIRTFLSTNEVKLHDVAFATTSNAASRDQAVRDVEEILHKTVKAHAGFVKSDVKTDPAAPKMKAFLDEIEKLLK
jgi:flavodoxin